MTIKMPNSDCDAHRDVTLSHPVCVICMDKETERLRAKVAELNERLTSSRNINKTLVRNFQKTEAQLTALPKWAQSSESKGQFYRKSVQEMAALREQLNALREGLEPHIADLRRTADILDQWQNPHVGPFDATIAELRKAASELQSLLTQTTPTVNSEGSVISGEDI